MSRQGIPAREFRRQLGDVVSCALSTESKESCGVSDHDCIRLDVLRDDGTGANDGSSADGDAVQDDRPMADPGSIADADPAHLIASGMLDGTANSVDSVIATHQCHFRAEQDIRPDLNGSCKMAVPSAEKTLSNKHPAASAEVRAVSNDRIAG